MSVPATELPPLEIVIVAYGSPEPLIPCLDALAGAFSPIVVDNSSRADTKAVAEAHGARYIDTGRNLGFGAGVNVGLRHRHDPSSDVLLLNPDAAITPTAIGDLQAELHADSSLACIAPAQVDPEGGAEVRVVWPRPTPLGSWIEAVGFGSRRRDTGFVIGSILLIRGRALDEVGFLDEQFFLYAEEADWEIRAQNKGWRVALSPGVSATHIGAGTGGDPRRRETHFHASHERLIRKHYGRTGWYAYRAANVAGAAVRGAVLPGESGRRNRFRFRLYAQGPVRAEAPYRADA